MAFGYIKSDEIEKLKNQDIFIEIEKIKYNAQILKKPLNYKDIRS